MMTVRSGFGVAYPGEYEVGDETVAVTEGDVYNGASVTPGQ